MRRFSRTYLLSLTAALAFILVAQAFIGHPGPTPYPLSYPAYYGNRINIPADNPLTVEGVKLGRRLFYEKRLSANTTTACANQQHDNFAGVQTGADIARLNWGGWNLHLGTTAGYLGSKSSDNFGFNNNVQSSMSWTGGGPGLSGGSLPY